MKNKFYSFLGMFFLLMMVSCQNSLNVIGEWEEELHRKQNWIFHENGNLEIIQNVNQQIESPINFKFKTIKQIDEIVYLEIQVYDGVELLKTEEQQIVFVDSDKIIIGSEESNIVSKTFIRKK